MRKSSADSVNAIACNARAEPGVAAKIRAPPRLWALCEQAQFKRSEDDMPKRKHYPDIEFELKAGDSEPIRVRTVLPKPKARKPRKRSRSRSAGMGRSRRCP